MAKKIRYWSKKPKEGNWDYIVIGSGMGGMTTAALLAKLGKKVLVLEQHYVPGGFTHAFRRKGYLWDVGVHAVGEVTTHSMPGRILHRLTDGNLKWASLGDHYEEFFYPEDFRIDFPNNPRGFQNNLLAAFPEETEAINEYFRLINEVARSMKGYYMSRITPKGISSLTDFFFAKKANTWLQKRTSDIVNGLTENPKLRSLMTAQWGYYGSIPTSSSFAMQALVVKHFWHGGYYPVGGSEEIANCLLKTVADNGGWTRIVADVKEIIIENKKAVGVTLSNGEEIRAPAVISAAGVMATIKRLLPTEYSEQKWVKEALSNIKPAPAHICLYIGFKGDIRQAGAGSANKWFWNTWESEQRAWDIDDVDNLEDCPILYCSFPSLKDPKHDPGPETRHTGEVVTFVPWDNFKDWQDTKWRKRGVEYDDFKKKIHDKILAQFIKNMPEIESMIDYTELSTPLSTDYFCRPMEGSIYGIEPTPERFQNPWLRPNSPIKNLYFSGSEVGTVGVIGAMMGGVLAAAAAEPMAAMRFLKDASDKRNFTT